MCIRHWVSGVLIPDSTDLFASGLQICKMWLCALVFIDNKTLKKKPKTNKNIRQFTESFRNFVIGGLLSYPFHR